MLVKHLLVELFLTCNLVCLSAFLYEDVTDHKNWKYAPKNCGRSKWRTGRIIGGRTSTTPGRFPWMARLGYTENDDVVKFLCGAVVITKSHVITAAHCIVYDEKRRLEIVRIGDYDEDDVVNGCAEKGLCPPPVQDIRSGRIFVHPKFDFSKVKNDIAVIQVRKKIRFGDFIAPICLPRGRILDKDLTMRYVTVAGWGHVDFYRKEVAKKLKFVNIIVRDVCACDNLYSFRDVDHSQICVGLNNGEDACNGDSGGPLMKAYVVNGTDTFYVMGIVSYGLPHCGEGPAVYTNVLYYMKWILDTLSFSPV